MSGRMSPTRCRGLDVGGSGCAAMGAAESAASNAVRPAPRPAERWMSAAEVTNSELDVPRWGVTRPVTLTTSPSLSVTPSDGTEPARRTLR